MLYSETINEVIPSTYHRRPEDIAFEADIESFFSRFKYAGYEKAKNQVEHFDFHFGKRVKLETKQREYPFDRFNTQYVPTSKLPKLVAAYESGWYNTLYLQRDINKRYFYFWVSDFTTKQLNNMPTYYNPEKNTGSKHNSRVFLIPNERFTEAKFGLDDVLVALMEERRRYVR